MLSHLFRPHHQFLFNDLTLCTLLFCLLVCMSVRSPETAVLELWTAMWVQSHYSRSTVSGLWVDIVSWAGGRVPWFWQWLQKYPLLCFFGFETESHMSKLALNSLWSQGSSWIPDLPASLPYSRIIQAYVTGLGFLFCFVFFKRQSTITQTVFLWICRESPCLIISNVRIECSSDLVVQCYSKKVGNRADVIQQPEALLRSDPQNPRMGNRSELTQQSCPLTSLWPYAHTHQT